MSVNIRAATVEDADQLKQIKISAVEAFFPDVYSKKLVDEEIQRALDQDYATMIGESGCHYILAEKNDEILGFASWRGSYIGHMYVLPKHSKKGVGKELLMHLETDARSKGVALLHLQASLNAEAFYQSNEYEKSKNSKLNLRGEHKFEVAHMSKWLLD